MTPILAVFIAVYALVLRPWHQRWGATNAEVRAILAGDDLIAATGQVTHAITINAPPEKVWPWLMQIGQDRAGFYSTPCWRIWLAVKCLRWSTLFPSGGSVERVKTVWFGTPRRFKGQAYMVAAVVEPHRAFVMVGAPDRKKIQAGDRGHGGSWGLVIEPVDASHSRLIARLRDGTPASLWARIVGATFWDPAHFIMERKMLRTIKRLAEENS